MEDLRLIVGLGNPGAEYARSRHNVGFMVVERLGTRWQSGDWSYEKKFNARLVRVERATGRVLLCEPQTYMNSSGEAVAAVLAYYQLTPEKLLVVLDDADLPLGELRLRPGGGTGGHHGLESVERLLGTSDYPRLRVGIGRRDGEREITGHVLGRFGSTEAPLVDTVLVRAVEQAECWLDAGMQKAMNQFNGVVNLSANEGKEQ
jgi:peptidyl-tRNA hydrolase, PTH1 family